MIALKHSTICNSILILITLYLTLLVSSENILKDKEEECPLPDQSKGVCKPSSECPDKGIGSVTCSKQGNIIYVCCESTVDGPVRSDSRRKPEPPDERKHNKNTTSEDDVSSEEISDRFLDDEGGFPNRDYSWNRGRRPEKHFKHTYTFGEDTFQDDVRREYGNYDFGNNQEWQWSPNGNQFSFNPDAVSGYEFPSNPNKQNNRFPDNNQPDEWTSHNFDSEIYQEQNKRQHSQNYPWGSNRRTTTTQRPYYTENNKGQNSHKYPWESDRRTTTRRPYYADNSSGQDNEEYLWGSNRRTTSQRPHYPDNNRGQNTQKYPWESDRRTTTRRPYYADNSSGQDNEEYLWGSNRRTTTTTQRPYYSENNKGQNSHKYPWESDRRPTREPYYPNSNSGQDNEEYPWGSNRRTTTTTQRPYYPDNNRGQNTQKYPWESDRRTTTRRPYYPDNSSGQDKEEFLWGSNRRTTTTTQRPYYSENNRGQNTQKYPWESDRRTTERSTTGRPMQKPNYGPAPDSIRPPYTSDSGKRKRISEIMCDEYSKPVTEVITGLPLIPNPVPIEIKVENCIFAHQLIVGGENTTIGEFPHMAAVGFFDNAGNVVWKCGGSLISDQFVLTAAHCTITHLGKPVRVRLGEYNINKTNDGAYPEDYWIADIINHPDYKPSSKYNDIALIKLSRKVTISKSIRPACLNVKRTIPETKVIAIGWGRVDKAGEQSDVLLKVGLDLIDTDSCRHWYNDHSSKNVLRQGIIDSQICAGDLFDKKDTCKGDSGGPIEVMSQSNRCVHYIVGITSFGKSCAVQAPGVYTRVSSYISWIERVVWPGQ